jgi:type IV secretion system protein VirB6
MASSDTLFQSIYDGYNETFSTGAGNNVTAGLTAAAGYIQGCLGLYVLICGILIMTGSMTFNSGIKRCIRALIIVALLTPAAYNQWVTTTFTQTIPQAISASLGGTAGESSVKVFDNLYNADDAMLTQALTTAGSDVSNIGKIVAAYLAMGLAVACLAIAFFVWFLAIALVYVVVPVGPYVLLFWLFDATRDIPLRFFAKLIGYMVLMVMVLSLTQIVQTQEKSYVTAFSAAMTSTPSASTSAMFPGLQTPNGTWLVQPPGVTVASGGNLDQQIAILFKTALSFLFGTALMIMLPGIAAYIGGGVAVQIAPMVTAAAKMVGL